MKASWDPFWKDLPSSSCMCMCDVCIRTHTYYPFIQKIFCQPVSLKGMSAIITVKENCILL